jgi:hypothetical protein
MNTTENNSDLQAMLDAFKATHTAIAKEKQKNLADLFLSASNKQEIVKEAIKARYNLSEVKPLNHFDLQWIAIAKPKNGKTNAEFWSESLMIENIELATIVAIESIKAKGMKSSFIPWLRLYNKASVGSFQKDNAL